MNSFDRISNLFAGVDNKENSTTADGIDDEEEDADMTNIDTRDKSSSTMGKDESKIPTKKSKMNSNKYTGQYGDKTSRKMGERKSRQDRISGGSSRGRSLEGRRQRSSSKKRSGKKLAML